MDRGSQRVDRLGTLLKVLGVIVLVGAAIYLYKATYAQYSSITHENTSATLVGLVILGTLLLVGGHFVRKRRGVSGSPSGHGPTAGGAPKHDAPIPAVPGPDAVLVDRLQQLDTLRQSGALSDEEFAAAKAKLLAGGG